MLKSVKDLVVMLENAFETGECTCIRCKSVEDEAHYKYAHNFMIMGKPHHRLFAHSSASDLDSRFRSAWVATLKDVDFNNTFSLSQLKEIIDDEHLELFHILGVANGYISKFENDEYQVSSL
ncbi:hypothetical protein [Pseudoalteromonas viridis]|uniref:Uncharacterized protein n=1 Tax=Pseudoalteromonas viridis TaxID=339617 RepID=A0ABX7V129_9GAMM|nr:hypothetical protein [Pseudoalteromonas viridis]QTL34494.1 hypothetical protein J5X90_13190 [Pseudoalteromonas viridis]